VLCTCVDVWQPSFVPLMSRLSPTSGPAHVSTTVAVLGGEFVAGNITCRFGDQTTTGSLISSTEIECLAPPLFTVAPGEQGVPLLFVDIVVFPPRLLLLATDTVTVEVSLDGGLNWTSNGKRFTYYRCPDDCSVCNAVLYCAWDITWLISRFRGL
jgi:hypothetical protein